MKALSKVEQHMTTACRPRAMYHGARLRIVGLVVLGILPLLSIATDVRALGVLQIATDRTKVRVDDTVTFRATTDSPAQRVVVRFPDANVEFSMTGSGTNWSLPKVMSKAGSRAYTIIPYDSRDRAGTSKSGVVQVDPHLVLRNASITPTRGTVDTAFTFAVEVAGGDQVPVPMKLDVQALIADARVTIPLTPVGANRFQGSGKVPTVGTYRVVFRATSPFPAYDVYWENFTISRRDPCDLVLGEQDARAAGIPAASAREAAQMECEYSTYRSAGEPEWSAFMKCAAKHPGGMGVLFGWAFARNDLSALLKPFKIAGTACSVIPVPWIHEIGTLLSDVATGGEAFVKFVRVVQGRPQRVEDAIEMLVELGLDKIPSLDPATRSLKKNALRVAIKESLSAGSSVAIEAFFSDLARERPVVLCSARPDGLYCSGTFRGYPGSSHELVSCNRGVMSLKAKCTKDCVTRANGVAECDSAPIRPCVGITFEKKSCGSSLVGYTGTQTDLVTCRNSQIVSVTPCPNSCQATPGMEPKCFALVDRCAAINCGAHGQCANGTCTCRDNYSGDLCQTPPRDPCASKNCGAHGQCANGNCTCRDNYMGNLCQTPPRDPCASKNCGAHGQCANGNCVCRDNYTGDLCQTPPRDPCVSINCGAHGQCRSGTCVCRDNYIGDRCQNPPRDPCTGVSCSGHGQCSGGRCTCNGGYTGASCDTAPRGPCTGKAAGKYCASSLSGYSGIQTDLVTCSGGTVASSARCDRGCKRMAAGTNDQCNR
jgi:hypothetical protein